MTETKPARLARDEADYTRFGIEKGNPQPFEDGIRTHGGRGTFEWWYTDANFEDGTTVVVIFFTKNYFDAAGPAWPTVDFEIVEADGTRTNVFVQGRKGAGINARKDICDVRAEGCHIRYEDGNYVVHYEGHGIVYDAVMKPKMPMWRPDTGIFLYGEGQDEKQYGWFVAQPEAEVDARLQMGGVTRELHGRGYHDHNWGDADLGKLMNHWYWGRAHVGPYNIIACDIITEKEYGYKRLPLFMLAKDGEILSDDCSITQVERAETHFHPFSGKFMDDILVYTQPVSPDEVYTVKFHRTHDYNNRSLLEVVSPFKRKLAQMMGLNPSYIRVAGDVSITERHGADTTSVEAPGLWEQYFTGTNKLAVIEGRTIPVD